MNIFLESEEITSDIEEVLANNLLEAPDDLEEKILEQLLVKKLEREN